MIFIAYICVIVSELSPPFRTYLTQAISWPLFVLYVYTKLSSQAKINKIRPKRVLSEYTYLISLRAQYETELRNAKKLLEDPNLPPHEKRTAKEGEKIARGKLNCINEIIAGYEIIKKSLEKP